MTAEEGTSLRDRWPRGPLGALKFFTDHIVFRNTRPVDWSALQAVENGLMHGRVIFDGGFFVLSDEEANVFQAIGACGSLEHARQELLGMSDDRINRCVERITRKSGVSNIENLIKLAERNL